RGLTDAGKRNEALLHYRRLEQLLQQDLGAQPESETRRLYDSIRAGASAAPMGAAASPLDDKPGIAVLTFDNIGGEASTARLANGLAEDIITDLARFRGLEVIARSSSGAYTGRPVDPRRIGQELHVRYLVQGSIQCDAGQIRVTAQLVDATTGMSLWSNR